MLLQNICTCCKIDTAGLSSYNLKKKNSKLHELSDKYFHPLKKVVLWTKVILTGDAIETGRRCLFGPSVYIFVTYEGVSVLGTDGHRQQTQTDAITP